MKRTGKPAGTFSRTVKFAVVFVGKTRQELEGRDGLWYSLARAQGEITRAANHVMNALWLINTGAMTPPELTIKRKAQVPGKPIAGRTLAWAAFRQENPWLPFGKLAYAPEGPRLAGSNLAVLASDIHTRITTDHKAICAGDQTLPTFRLLPLPLDADSVKLRATDAEPFLLDVTLWAHKTDGGSHVQLAPVLGSRDHGARSILGKILAGEYKHGNARLFRDERKGKWTLALSWTGAVAPRSGTLLAGVHLGLLSTASVSYVDLETGAVQRFKDRVHIPETTVNAWKATEAARTARLRHGRLVYDAEGRAGRGVTRKIRPVEDLSGKRLRLVQEAVRQVASAVVLQAIKRGASVIAIEDLSWSPDRKFDDTAEWNARTRVEARKNFLVWQQGQLREQIGAVAEREGLARVIVHVDHGSNTCHACGAVYPRPRQEPWMRSRPYCIGVGRLDVNTFVCACGTREHADRNAAINDALRGRVEWLERAKKVLDAENTPR